MQINFFKTIRSSQSQNACARIEGKGDQSALFQKIKRTRCTIIGFFQEPKKVATPVTWGRQLTAVIQSPEHQLATSKLPLSISVPPPMPEFGTPLAQPTKAGKIGMEQVFAELKSCQTFINHAKKREGLEKNAVASTDTPPPPPPMAKFLGIGKMTVAPQTQGEKTGMAQVLAELKSHQVFINHAKKCEELEKTSVTSIDTPPPPPPMAKFLGIGKMAVAPHSQGEKTGMAQVLAELKSHQVFINNAKKYEGLKETSVTSIDTPPPPPPLKGIHKMTTPSQTQGKKVGMEQVLAELKEYMQHKANKE
ncbi:hypothetical protein O7C57_19035 [Providencia sp. 21OH12SH02B-Prov]|uniref:hypothetical protein n=1 Tax=Providencia sp. 21OH12SH02B-Prov TaxID=3015951 RepID=UPI0022B6EB0A|nr:hypothetical protein [Providencia sp. 21OH12SH02B-Prov]WBA56885.1 hypothetical protein O7C57_19035 [Providencia sp. 21OH12SH02B-Prov]